MAEAVERRPSIFRKPTSIRADEADRQTWSGQLHRCGRLRGVGPWAADAVLDKVKATAYLATDRVHVLRQAIMCCRKAGTISIPGVYVGMGDKIPLGAAMNKGLTIKTGQTHVQAYTKPLLKLIEDGEIDPSFVVTHPASLEDAPAMYKKFRDKEDGVIKVMLRPGG
jgi:threonine dehydrogenase-like Zn-dependent dehydrogenase